MAKEILNPVEIRICVHNPTIHWALARYPISCEHEIEEKRELLLTQTENLVIAIHDLEEEVLTQIYEHEGLSR